MQKLCFAYPGDLDTPTGGYGYDREIIKGLRAFGWHVDLLPLGDGFPFPSDTMIEDAGRKLEALPQDTLVVVDGLAFGILDKAAARVADHLCLVALVHHPLCRENGLDTEQKTALFDSEKEALRHARHVIVTSPATAGQVEELFCVPNARIATVLPGTDKPAAYARPKAEQLKLLSVGTVVPRKGYDLLFEALAGLPEESRAKWHLDIVGGLEADPECYAALQRQAARLKLDPHITFHGAVSRKDLDSFYRAANIFVLASRYEGYGMAYTEALAHGLPVIGSGGGAVRETLPEGAAIYCGNEDVAALREALDRMVFDAGTRAAFEEAARAAARGLPDWADAAARFAAILEETRS